MMQKNKMCLIQCLIFNQKGAQLIFKIILKVISLKFKENNIKQKQLKKVKVN